MSSPLCGVRWFGSSSFARSAALGAAAARAVSAATCPASGKTFLACALGQRACRHGYRASYWRTPRLVDELTLARADGTLSRLLAGLARVDLLIIDDWGITPLRDQDRRDLFEVVEDRDGSRSTLVASQIPISGWHDYLGDPTIADAIVDRLLHSAHRITLKGPSRRKDRKKADPQNT